MSVFILWLWFYPGLLDKEGISKNLALEKLKTKTDLGNIGVPWWFSRLMHEMRMRIELFRDQHDRRPNALLQL